jgi:hypothetical protein
MQGARALDFITYCSAFNSACANAAEVFMGNPYNITAANQLAAIILEYTSSQHVEYSSTSLQSVLATTIFDDLFRKSANMSNKMSIICVPLMIFHGHFFMHHNKSIEAIEKYLAAFVADSTQPFTSLCIASCLMSLNANPFAKSKRDIFTKTLGFFAHYINTRLDDSLILSQYFKWEDSGLILIKADIEPGSYPKIAQQLCIMQEVYYNTACTFREIGITHLAESYFLKSLSIDNTRKSLVKNAQAHHSNQSNGRLQNLIQKLQYFPLTKVTAYNLMLLYKSCGNEDLAFIIMSEYLSY